MAIFLSALDPLTEDPRLLLDREDEAAREQRWVGFITQAKDLGQRQGWPRLLKTVADVMRTGPHESQRVEVWIAGFAETEGFSGVLAALSCALKASGQ